MHHPTDRIPHTTAFVTPVVEHWLEREIAQWVHPMKDRSDDPSHHERTLYLWVTSRSLNMKETLHSTLHSIWKKHFIQQYIQYERNTSFNSTFNMFQIIVVTLNTIIMYQNVAEEVLHWIINSKLKQDIYELQSQFQNITIANVTSGS